MATKKRGTAKNGKKGTKVTTKKPRESVKKTATPTPPKAPIENAPAVDIGPVVE